MKQTIIMLMLFLQVSCTGLPKDITPINNFDVQQYLGTWYEIARLDHSFEKDLTHVTADYSIRDNGSVKVVNKGYNAKKNQWKTAEGKAYFMGDKNQAHLKVSFFGPFYGSYVVFKMDSKNYQYSYVTSYNKDYLWLLARTPEVSNEVKNDFLKTAKDNGFNTNKIIFVDQSMPNCKETTDHIPLRSHALFRARAEIKAIMASFSTYGI